MLRNFFSRNHGSPQSVEAPHTAQGVVGHESIGKVVLDGLGLDVATPESADVHKKSDAVGIEFKLPNGEIAPSQTFVLSGARENGAWALVSDVQVRNGLIAEGPSYFDSQKALGGTHLTEVVGGDLPTGPSDERYTILTTWSDAEGLVHHRALRATIASVDGVFSKDNPEQVEKNDNSTGNGIVDTAPGEIGYLSYAPYTSCEAIRTAFDTLGFAPGTTPSPETFKRRIDALRAQDTASGVYYPKIRLLPTGGIKAVPYLEAYAAKEHPVATKSFRHFYHDIASEHLQALMQDGEPLMDLLAAFAQVSLDPKSTITFTAQRSEREKVGDLTGEDKLKRATTHIDSLTMLMSDRTTDSRKKDELLAIAGDILSAVKKNGVAGSVPFITDMVADKTIGSVEDLTAEQLVSRIRQLTDERLAITQSPYTTNFAA